VAAGDVRSFAPLSFPHFLVDNWLFQATMPIPAAVPILLRTSKPTHRPTQSQEAAPLDCDLRAHRANGRIAYDTC